MPNELATLDPGMALRFAIALGIGFLIGLERERKKEDGKSFAGVRTFTLIALFGASAAFLQAQLALPWIGLAAFGALTILVVTSYNITGRQGEIGVTTELASLLVFLIGGLAIWGHLQLAAALGVVVLLLLALKDGLHRLAERVDNADVDATLKFAVISLIVLPLLPNQNFGPAGLEVINLYKIWWMVVLISGLNFVGYLLIKILGSEHGLILTGLLGGLVSSTAVTLGFSQRSKEESSQAPAFALAILLAWTVMFFRVVIEVGVVNRALAWKLLPAMGVLGFASLVMCFVLWRKSRGPSTGTVATGSNPFELGEAIKFGLLFGVVLFVARAAQVWAGDAGLYLAGALAGLTDVDAIALSMADLAKTDPASSVSAARTVVIAVLSNTVVKAGMVVSLAAVPLRKAILPISAILVAAGTAAIFFLV